MSVSHFKAFFFVIALVGISALTAHADTVAYYRFETNNGVSVSNGQTMTVADDSSGNNRNGVAVGATVSDRDHSLAHVGVDSDSRAQRSVRTGDHGGVTGLETGARRVGRTHTCSGFVPRARVAHGVAPRDLAAGGDDEFRTGIDVSGQSTSSALRTVTSALIREMERTQ